MTMKRYSSLLFLSLNFSLIASLKTHALPSSGHASPMKLSKNSLLLDQPFDRESHLPQSVLQPALALGAKTAPRTIQEVLNVEISNIRTLQTTALQSLIGEELNEKIEALPSEWVSNLEQDEAQLNMTLAKANFVEGKAAPVKSAVSTAQTLLSSASQRTVASLSSELKNKATAVRPTPSPAPTSPAPVITETKSDPIADIDVLKKQKPFVPPRAEANRAKIFVVSHDSVRAGDPRPLAGAQVFWVSENSGLMSVTDENGVAYPPKEFIKRTQSMRYIVKAREKLPNGEVKTYIPAVGYAMMGQSLPVSAITEEHFARIRDWFRVHADKDYNMVIGQVLDRNLTPVPRIKVDTSNMDEPFKIFYAVVGAIYNPLNLIQPTATGDGGEFFIKGLRKGALQYFMPTRYPDAMDSFAADTKNAVEWPATILSNDNLPDAYSITLVQSLPTDIKFKVADAQFEKEDLRAEDEAAEEDEDMPEQPLSPPHVTVGGQSGLSFPDQHGNVKLSSVGLRNSPDVFVVQAKDYRPVWISAALQKTTFPDTVFLYRQDGRTDFLAKLFGPEKLPYEAKEGEDVNSKAFMNPNLDVNLDAFGTIVGDLRRGIFKRAAEILVYDYNTGLSVPSAQYFYLTANNRFRRTKSTNPQLQDFAIANLAVGEYQVVALDKETGEVLGTQVVRVEAGAVSQIRF